MSHEKQVANKDEWLTPKYIIDDLGPFDLDPCASEVRPWETAKNHLTYLDNGLMSNWNGFVWCNPPYGKLAGSFMEKMALHNNGVALVAARTETRWWFNYIWPNATIVMFLKGRLKFCDTKGIPAGNAGFPSALIGYGDAGRDRIIKSSLRGKKIIL